MVTTRVEIADPPRQSGQDFLDLLTAAARGDIVIIPVLVRRLVRIPDELAHIVRLPVTALLKALGSVSGRLRAPSTSVEPITAGRVST